MEVTNAVDQSVEKTVTAPPGKPDDADEAHLQGFSSPMPPAGWFPDPESPAQLRYWDGSAWTEHGSPVTAPTSQEGQDGPQPGRAKQTSRLAKTVLLILGGVMITVLEWVAVIAFDGPPLIIIGGVIVTIMVLRLVAVISSQDSSGTPDERRFDVTNSVDQPVPRTSIPGSPDEPAANFGRRLLLMTKVPGVKAPAIGLGVGVAIVIAMSIVALTSALTSGSSQADASSSTSAGQDGQAAASVAPTTQAPTPHDICVLQLLAVAADIQANGSAAVATEEQINGASDPFFTEGVTIGERTTGDSYTVGASTALLNAQASASTACTNTLLDQIRANYPTDGTYP